MCLRLLLTIALAWVAAAPTHAALPLDVRGTPTLAPMLVQVTPAVVNISVQTRSAQENPLLRDPFFRRFFDQPERPRVEQSAGSGVIIDAARGLVLTNHHVVSNAIEIVVTLKDRRQLKAQLVGADPATDIALVRIPAEGLTALKMGDSDEMAVGDFVVAIGNPFGIGQTVTSGIVSALGRTGLGIEGYEDFIQTDASINPGNSGGALVNLRGELIGINTAIIGPSGGNVGIGFAVPMNMVRAVVDQLIRFGEVRRGRLGVSTTDVTPQNARDLKSNTTEGAVIMRIEANSAAERAGLRQRDVVTTFNGRPVRSSGDLRNRIGLTPTGDEIELRVLRDGAPMTIRARIAETQARAASAITAEGVPQLAGASVANVEPGMPFHGQIEGAVITGVERGTSAHRNGLRIGDVVFGVNRARVRSAEELLSALRTVERPWRLSLLRGEQRVGLVIR
ncbi:MAG: Do family serine endopeptidase [Burkholderiales bacterium]